ncbi:hypothetical protein PATSB16_18590 [Pandoraea thiooxydans]|nr:hypothetical protein [Pandoraea thiooxydans]APR95199.1 hypothetical protein PATSB16_18590 [Pandoraea thiooxydans]
MVNMSVARLCGYLVLPIALAFSMPCHAQPSKLQLAGYADPQGAISIQYNGDTIDPYFALQALLLARENGLDISPYARQWADWLVQRQKPDGTFDRYCRRGPVWAPCKTADADDALVALWLKFLDTMPAELKKNPVWQRSYQKSVATLSHLIDPVRGIYLVSPVYQHGLFMDNLEVLSYRPKPGGGTALLDTKKLARNIHTIFWDKQARHFLVSTQSGQDAIARTFYPDDIAQLFPLLFKFDHLPTDPHTYYEQWMHQYRAAWLMQSHADFSWGLVAVVALDHGDPTSASCWLRETRAARNTSHWIVTDEVARQILAHKGVTAAGPEVSCQ